jgi:hypothetical protein
VLGLPTVPCPTSSAALLRWVKKRVPVREPSRLGLVDRLLSSPGWKNADHFAADYFQGAAARSTSSRRLAPDPAHGRQAVRACSSSRRRRPVVPLEPPQGHPEVREAQGHPRLAQAIAPELRAEYDERRRIVLRPVWGEGVTPGTEARWHFDGTTYHALDTVPRDLKSYFKGERVIERTTSPSSSKASSAR